tara:strand:+ start:770 stop:1315 length:546 start_codon:yes stop_codon:yes gene_type:complete
MIRLKQLLRELSDSEKTRLLDKIKNKQFRLIGGGDNGRVYTIDGEDKVFKITTERDEFEVATIIVNRSAEFTCFIPVYYVSDREQMYIMSNAEQLTEQDRMNIDAFTEQFKQFARSEGGEVSIFNFLDADGARNMDVKLVNFIRALQRDVDKLGIADFDLDLDFSSSNMMLWNNKLVLVDW